MFRKMPSYIALIALLLAAATSRAEVPSTRPSIPIIEVHGTAAEMGVEHGKKLARPIALLREKYLKVFLGTTAHRLIALAAAKAFEQQILPEHLAEINALAGQVGMGPPRGDAGPMLPRSDSDVDLLHDHAPGGGVAGPCRPLRAQPGFPIAEYCRQVHDRFRIPATDARPPDSPRSAGRG